MYKKLLAILLLLSVSVFSCSACFADDIVKIGGGGTALLIYENYQDTLPDGRMIFSGRGGADYEWQRARLGSVQISQFSSSLSKMNAPSTLLALSWK